MKANNEAVKDTLFNITKSLDRECIIGDGCKNHTHLHTEIVISEMQQIQAVVPFEYRLLIDGKFMYFSVNEFGDTMQVEKPEPPKKTIEVNTMQNKDPKTDSIKPLQEFISVQSTKIAPIQLKAIKTHITNIEQKPTYDSMCQSLCLTFMCFVLIHYAYSSFNCWNKLFSELKAA